MRLLHLTRDLPPAASGIGDHAARVAREHASMGHDVVVVCAQPDAIKASYEIRSVDWDAHRAISDACRAEAPDAIVWHYNPFQFGRYGFARDATPLAKALAGIAPLVTVAHELWYPWGRAGLRGFLWAFSQRACFEGVVHASSKMFLTTPARYRELCSRFPSKASAFGVIGAGATIEPSSTVAPSSVRDRLGIPRDAFVIAHLGAIGEGRDLSPALEAITQMRRSGNDVRLLLIGRTGVGVPSHDFVFATGSIGHEELSAALFASDAYLFAEPTGPVPRKTSLLSAMAHGLPVIAYRGPAADPEFRDGEQVMLVDTDATAIVDAILRMQNEAGLKAHLAAHARALIEREYSWPRIAEAVAAAAAAGKERVSR